MKRRCLSTKDAREWAKRVAQVLVQDPRVQLVYLIASALNEASVILAHDVADNSVGLFARDAAIETDFVIRTRSRYWDFNPFLEEQWRLAGE